MARLAKSIVFETTFGEYTVDEIIGEGGAGRVYAGVDGEGRAIALKLLAKDRASKDKRRRFKNEIAFLARNQHANIVSVLDHGLSDKGDVTGPFYVMKRYDGSLRTLIGKMSPEKAIQCFGQIIDGLEAAHLQGVVHRDMKPENILLSVKDDELAIADFGIARFSEDLLVTLVETEDTQRLANFQYAAPEQRARGKDVGIPADIYALGLILHEMFTATVPHGTNYQKIASVSEEHAYLDEIVAKMLRQDQRERFESIGSLKTELLMRGNEALSLQHLSKINGTVIKAGEIDHPLAFEPPKITGVDWRDGILSITLDREVDAKWVEALKNMGNYSAVYRRDPHAFNFRGKVASSQASDHEVQAMVNHFKDWLPLATRKLKQTLEQENQHMEAQLQERLRREREAEERRLRVLEKIKF